MQSRAASHQREPPIRATLQEKVEDLVTIAVNRIQERRPAVVVLTVDVSFVIQEECCTSRVIVQSCAAQWSVSVTVSGVDVCS